MLAVAALAASLLAVLASDVEVDGTMPPDGRFELRVPGADAGLRVGVFLSGWVDAGALPPQALDNGLVLTDARLVARGLVGEHLDVLTQLDLRQARLVVDAVLRVRPVPGAWVRLGRFKVPFGGEALIPDALIDFNEFAQATSALTLGRSTGAELGVGTPEGALQVRGGLFSSRLDPTDPDDTSVAALRARAALEHGEALLLEVGAHAAITADRGSRLALGDELFNGSRVLGGANVRLRLGDVTASAEVATARVRPSRLPSTQAIGHHVTLAYQALPWLAALLRWDALFVADGPPRQLLIPSVAAGVPGYPEVQLQADAYVPLDEPGQARILASVTLLM